MPQLFDIACTLLILLFVPAIMLPANRELLKDPLIRLGILFFLYVLFSIIWHKLTLPEDFPATSRARRYLRVLYFIPIAYAISRSRLFSAWQMLGVAFCGLLVYLAINFDQAEWIRAWRGQRVDFGIINAQHTGIVFATCALAFTVFTSRFCHWAKGASPIVALPCAILWIAALLFSLWGVLVSQTRAVWLGLSIALLLLPCVIGLACFVRGKPRSSLRKPVATGIICTLLLGFLAAGFNLPALVSERLAAEKVTLESLRLAASHEKQNLTSLEVRVATWSAAPDWIMERPFMGWSGRGAKPLILQSDLFSDAFKKHFNHLHNSYLQVLVEIGLIGAAFIIALIVRIGHGTLMAYRHRSMPLDVFIFSWLFFIFWVVVNIFESYIIFPTGTYLIVIVTAFLYSFCIDEKKPASQ